MENIHNHNSGESAKPKKGIEKIAESIKGFFPDQSGKYVIAFAACLILLLLFITALKFIDYKPHGKTSLDTKITILDQDFSLAHGCFAYIEGTVTNTGQGNANEVSVSCVAKNNKRELRKAEFHLGPVLYNSERKFNERIDYGCFDGGIGGTLFFECKAYCADGSCSLG
jgi:hypothetical protein